MQVITESQLEQHLEKYRENLYRRRQNKYLVQNLLSKVDRHISLNQQLQLSSSPLRDSFTGLANISQQFEKALQGLDDQVQRGTKYNYNQICIRFKQQFVLVKKQLQEVLKNAKEIQELIGDDTNFVTLLYNRLRHFRQKTAVYFSLYQETHRKLSELHQQYRIVKDENSRLTAKYAKIIKQVANNHLFDYKKINFSELNPQLREGLEVAREKSANATDTLILINQQLKSKGVLLTETPSRSRCITEHSLPEVMGRKSKNKKIRYELKLNH